MALRRSAYSSSKEYIRIEGDAAHLVSEQIIKTVKVSDVIEELKHSGVTITPFLPKNCRYFYKKHDTTVVVIEQEPKVRVTRWQWNPDDASDITVKKLAFPYVVFVISFRGLAITDNKFVYYRTSPLTKLSDALLRTNLCNVFKNNSICNGTWTSSGNDIASKADSFTSGFWTSPFNQDLYSETFKPAAESFPEVSDLDQWEAMTVQDKLFPLGISWHAAGTTIEDLVNDITRYV